MKPRKIYDIIRKRSPISVCDEPELLEQFEGISLEDLMEDLEDLYQEWGSLPKLYRARKKEDLQKIQECESLFAFILEEIFSYGDPSVIPQLLKYVPSDDTYEDEDLVFLEDYSSEPLCNGITEAQYFGEAYIPVLLKHIHEIVPRALQNAAWFLYGMIYDDLVTFLDSRPLINNLRYAQKEPFLRILEYAFQSCLESLKDKDEKVKQLVMEKIKHPIGNITNEDDGVIQIAYLRQELLKLHASN